MSRIYGTKEGTIKYEKSNQIAIPLNKNYHVQRYMVKLSVNHTNTSAVFKKGLLGLINSLQIVGNGDTVIKSVPAAKFVIGELMASGNECFKNINKTDGTKDSFIWFTVYMAIPNAWRPADTIFNTAVYSTLNMIINWADGSAIGSGVVVNSARCDVHSHSLTNYLRNAGEKIKHYKETYLKKDITVTSSELTIDLPTKHLYRCFSVVSTVDNVPSDLVIKKITIKSGTTIIAQLDAQEIQAINFKDYKIQDAVNLRGLHIIDFLSRGKNADLLDTYTAFNTLEMVLDVEKQAGINTLHIYSDTIEITQNVEVQ